MICVVIPTYNNATTIQQVINDVLKYIPDIIVVNDGSTDNTAEILEDIDKIDVVTLHKNQGKGRALVAGFREAKKRGFSHAITIDADGQHYPDDIPLFLSAIKQNPKGIIVGSRNLNEENMPQQNTFANKFSNFWFRLQTGINLPDTQSGYRLYCLSTLRGLRWITSRYEAELELLVFAAWAGTKITSIPVRVYYPPLEERVSHFRPIRDFARISILNTILCIVALFFHLRQILYSIFSFVYFLFLALDMTIRGFVLITCLGNTPEHKLRYHRILQRKAKFVINHVPGTSFSFSNPHNETFEKPAVIIANHQSHLDLMAIMMLSPKIIILTKDWVWKNPFYGLIIRYADFLPVSDTELLNSRTPELLKNGYSIMIFPEGTRSENGNIQRFHRGAFYLAEKLQMDIIPVFIDGFHQVLAKKAWCLSPGQMTMQIMERIRREDIPADCDYRQMTKHLHHVYIEKDLEYSMSNHNY